MFFLILNNINNSHLGLQLYTLGISLKKNKNPIQSVTSPILSTKSVRRQMNGADWQFNEHIRAARH